MPSKACENKKGRKQLFTLEFDQKISHKILTKTAHKTKNFPKKTKKEILEEKNEKKNYPSKTRKNPNFKQSKDTNIPHPTYTHKIFQKIPKKILMGPHPSYTAKKSK